MQAYIERIVCKGTDFVWWFTEGALHSAQLRHGELGSRGAHIIPGLAAPTVKGEYHRSDKMIISHFGSLSETRSMQPFVEAMHTLLERKQEKRNTIHVHVYGGSIDRACKEAIASYGLGDVSLSFGRLECSAETGMSGRDQVLVRMFQSDCLLFKHGVISDFSEYIHSKLYEYIWTHRPVISLTYLNS